MKRIKFFLIPWFVLCVVIGLGTIIYASNPVTVSVSITTIFDEDNIVPLEDVVKDYGTKVAFDSNLGSVEGYHFDFWVVNGTVRQDLPISHQFTITYELDLIAVFSAADKLKHAVLFMDSNGKLLDTQYIADKENAAEPDLTFLPDKPGFTIASNKWNGVLTNITESKIFILQYEKITETTFSLSVTGGTGAGDGLFDYNSIVTATATIPDGKYFSHWEENSKIVSRTAEYKFTMLSNRNITAVFVDSAPVQTPTVAISSNLQLRNWHRSYLCQFDIPSGYTYVEHGIITSVGATDEQIIDFTTGDVKRYISNKYFAETKEYVMSVPIGSHKAARAYLVVQEGDTISTVYSANIPFDSAMMPSNVATQPATGTGTQESPYIVSNINELYWITLNDTSWDKYFEQSNNIDLSVSKYWNEGAGWNPIGVNIGNSFTGSYDGKGYIIYGLMINRPDTANVGLFGHVGNSSATTTIKNLGLINVDVKGARGSGSLIGRVTGQEYTTVTNCFAIEGTVVGDGATGGLIGSHNSYVENPSNAVGHRPILSYSYANIDVSFSGKESAGKDKFGGLTGCTQKGKIENSYAMGSVTANGGTRVGGLTGCIELRGLIVNTYSTGAVSGAEATLIGGLVGNNTTDPGNATDSFWDVETSLQESTAENIGTPYTTVEMKEQTNFTSWDFTNTWSINANVNNGYPYLNLR